MLLASRGGVSTSLPQIAHRSIWRTRGCGQGFSTPADFRVCCETDKKRDLRGHRVIIQAVKRQLYSTIQNCRAFLREWASTAVLFGVLFKGKPPQLGDACHPLHPNRLALSPPFGHTRVHHPFFSGTAIYINIFLERRQSLVYKESRVNWDHQQYFWLYIWTTET